MPAMPDPIQPNPVRARRRGESPVAAESGSAYVLALLVLLILSVVGLALVFVTETESQLGDSERILARTFYAAESGIPVAVARRQILGDYAPFRFRMNADQPSLFTRADEIQTSSVYMVQLSHCNTCDASWNAPSGTGGGSGAFMANQYVITSEAARMVSADGVTEHPMARQGVSAYVTIQPDQGPSDLRSQGREHGRVLAENLPGNSGTPTYEPPSPPTP